MSREMSVRRHVRDVVALIAGRIDWIVEARGIMAERRVDETSLTLAGPHGPAIPFPRVFVLAMPIEVADVACFEVDGVAVVRTQDRNSRVRSVRHAGRIGRAARSINYVRGNVFITLTGDTSHLTTFIA